MTEVSPHRTLLERLVAASSEGMVGYDRIGRITIWNPEMERISGLAASDVLGRDVFELFPFLEETGGDAALRGALEGRSGSAEGLPYRVESTGRRGTYDAAYEPSFDEHGAPVGAIAIVRDTTKMVATENQLRETETRFKNVADVAPVLLWMSNTEGLCTFFNQTWLDFTGRSLEDEWGVGWASGVHFEDFQRCMDVYTDSFNRRESFEMEYRLRRHDGAFRHILDRGTPRFLPNGEFTGFIGSCVDITELKLLEAELRHAIRVRDEFLSVASHELRTPLTALQLQLEIVRRSVTRPSEEDTRDRSLRGAESALAKARHLDEMVGVLLDVSRLSREGMRLERSDVDVVSLVAEVVERATVSAQKSGCELRVGRLVARTGSWDRVRIGQVLSNVLTNAIRHAPGKPIEIHASLDGETVVLAVSDGGPGIAPEHQGRIFERFTRLAPTENFGGLGLGLWISKQIVDAHGGTIAVASHPGEGATFLIALPAVPLVAAA